MTGPAVSVVVPTRGGAERLPVLLAALEDQDTDDFEVVVVIDGDIDGTANLVASWEGRLPVRSVVFPQNRGRAAALNAGAEAARGDLLIRSDDDLEPDPGFVSGHLERHRAAAGPIGVVGLTTNEFPETPFARAYGHAANKRFLDDALSLPPDRTWRLWSANVSVDARIHAALGGYDERYHRYGWEDVDFGYRLHEAGIPVIVAPEVMAVHHGASTTTAVRSIRALHSGAARETFLEIHGNGALAEPPRRGGLWNRCVGAAAMVASERTLRAYGAAVDTAARVLPVRLAEKLMALGVESGGLAGIRYPDRARARF